MLEALRHKLQSVQLDFSSGIKNLRTRKSPSLNRLSTAQLCDIVNPDAGAELLDKYQQEWEVIRAASEQNSQHADRCASELARLGNSVERRCSAVSEVARECGYGARKCSEEMSSLVEQVATIEGLCDEVESALGYLHVLCLHESHQERKLDQQFQLALYREHKIAQLNEMKGQLANEYLRKAEQTAARKRRSKAERQKHCQDQFEADMAEYRTTGKLPSSGSLPMSRSMPSCADGDLSPSEDLDDAQLEYDDTDMDDWLATGHPMSRSFSGVSTSQWNEVQGQSEF